MDINIPIDILEKNKSIRPDHLQANYDRLMKESNLYRYIPLNPFSKGAKERMEGIMDIFIECYEWKIHPSYKKLISYLAYHWMWGKPLGELLAVRVSYVREHPPKKDTPSKDTPPKDASTIIREYLGTLDHEVRFKLVKYFSAYIDILRHVLSQNGINLDKDIEPYHVYLEFGSCERKALNIMAMGLSRFTALHLSKILNIDDALSNVDDCYEIIKRINIDSSPMPYVCKQEVYRMLGRRS